MIPLTNISVWFAVKILSLILLGMYLVFAWVIVKQVQVMTKTLKLGFELPIKIFSYFHLAFAVFVFITALVIL